MIFACFFIAKEHKTYLNTATFGGDFFWSYNVCIGFKKRTVLPPNTAERLKGGV
jgi:hypothetical protein